MSTIAEVKEIMSTSRAARSQAGKAEIDALLDEKAAALRDGELRDELHRLSLELGQLKDSVVWLRHELRTLFAVLYERREAVDHYVAAYREEALPERIASAAPVRIVPEAPEPERREQQAAAPKEPTPQPRSRGEQKGLRRWITNGADSRKILINEEIPEGWAPGRAGAFGKDRHMDIVDRSQQDREAFQASALAAHFNGRRLDASGTARREQPVLCRDCGEPIHPERLRLVRNVTRCARCQREHDQRAAR